MQFERKSRPKANVGISAVIALSQVTHVAVNALIVKLPVWVFWLWGLINLIACSVILLQLKHYSQSKLNVVSRLWLFMAAAILAMLILLYIGIFAIFLKPGISALMLYFVADGLIGSMSFDKLTALRKGGHIEEQRS
jgi:quinol-cytochrome oxidoreductase complex cytochrome b subunit